MIRRRFPVATSQLCGHRVLEQALVEAGEVLDKVLDEVLDRRARAGTTSQRCDNFVRS